MWFCHSITCSPWYFVLWNFLERCVKCFARCGGGKALENLGSDGGGFDWRSDFQSILQLAYPQSVDTVVMEQDCWYHWQQWQWVSTPNVTCRLRVWLSEQRQIDGGSLAGRQEANRQTLSQYWRFSCPPGHCWCWQRSSWHRSLCYTPRHCACVPWGCFQIEVDAVG